MELNAAIRRNKANDYEEKALFILRNQTKEAKRVYSIQSFSIIKNRLMNQSWINWKLAQSVTKSLNSLKCFDSLKESCLNKIDFKSYCQLSRFIVDLLTEDLKEILYKIILLSRTTDLINLASSNSITLLNKAGFLFKNIDLSNIKIPNSDLSYGVFINSDLKSSNFYGVDLSMASIYDSNFTNCNMTETVFGEEILIDDLKADLLAFSPCGRFLAISCENELWLYEAKKYKKIAQFSGHDCCIRSLLFSDNSSYLTSCSDDRIILWSSSYISQIDQFQNFRNYSSFSPCNNYLCLVFWDNMSDEKIVKIYSIPLKKIVNEIRGFYTWFTLAIFSYSGQNLIFLDKNSFLSIWNLFSNIKISEAVCAHFEPIAISPKRNFIALLYWNNKIAIYSTENLEIIMIFPTCLHSDFLKFSFCGRYLALVSEINGIEIFDLEQQHKVYDFYGNSKWHDKSLAISQWNWNTLVFGSSDKKLKLWKIKPNNEMGNKLLTKKGIKMISFSNDSKYFVVGTEEGCIFIYLTDNQKLINSFQAHLSCISCISCSESVLATTSIDCLVKIWNIYNGLLLKVIKTDLNCRWIEFSPDGRKILSCDTSNFVTIWNIEKNEIVANWSAHWDYECAYMARWSPCENFLITCSSDWSIKIWRTCNKELLTVLNGHIDGVYSIKLSNCGKFLISCDMGQNIKIWHLGDMKKGTGEINVIKELRSERIITSITWSKDRASIIASDVEGNIVIWNSNTGKIAHRISAHKGAATLLSLSSDERFIISTGKDNAVKLWKFEKIQKQFIN